MSRRWKKVCTNKITEINIGENPNLKDASSVLIDDKMCLKIVIQFSSKF